MTQHIISIAVIAVCIWGSAHCYMKADPCERSSVCLTGFRQPSPTNCTRYYVCDNTSPKRYWASRSCGQGFLFDMDTLECSPPHKATCHPPCPVVTTTAAPPVPAVRVTFLNLDIETPPIAGQELRVACVAYITENRPLNARPEETDLVYEEGTLNQVRDLDLIPPVIHWYLNGERVIRDQRYRVMIEERPVERVTNGYMSNITFNPASVDDSGRLECRVVQSSVVLDSAQVHVEVAPRAVITSYAQCPTYIDNHNIEWPATPAGQTAVTHCPEEQIGEASRGCSDSGWMKVNLVDCVSSRFFSLNAQLEEGGTQNVANTVSQVLMDHSEEPDLSVGNLNSAVGTLKHLTDSFDEHEEWDVTIENIDTLVVTASNLLSPKNLQQWADLLEVGQEVMNPEADQSANPPASTHADRAVTMMESMESVGHLVSRVLVNGEGRTLGGANVEIQARSVRREDGSEGGTSDGLMFPDPHLSSYGWSGTEMESVEIPVETIQALADDNPDSNIVITATRYATLGDIMSSAGSSVEQLASRIVAVAVQNVDPEQTAKLQAPVQLQFENQMSEIPENATESCVYWDFSLSEGSGGWSTSGCEMVHKDSTHTTCQCHHLTNFAVLVSHAPASGIHHAILGFITIIGLSVSIIALIVTLFVFYYVWRNIKSQNSLVMVNLCVALILGNLFFMLGIEETDNEEVCQAMAVLIHYFYLCAFALMAAQGVLLFVYLVIVFHVKRKYETLAIMLSAWGAPAIIVALTMGITKMEAYGTTDFCWLNIENGAIWAFLGPVTGVIALNMVILAVAMRSITKPTKARKQSSRDNVKSTVWNMIVLLPILGVTWLFGAFAINQGSVVFQYLFAICNSFQGLFIFIFHCFFNRRVRDAVMDKLQKNPHTPDIIRPLLKKKKTTTTTGTTPRTGGRTATTSVSSSNARRPSAPGTTNNTTNSNSRPAAGRPSNGGTGTPANTYA